MKKVVSILTAMLCLLAYISRSQPADSTALSIKNIPSKYYAKINKKITAADDQLTGKSVKYLATFQKQEAKLQRRMQRLNPQLIIDSAKERYLALAQTIKSKAAPIAKIAGGEYNAYLDTLETSLSFLKQFNGVSDKVKQPLASFSRLQNKLRESEKIKAFIAERKNQLKEMLSKYTKLPAGLKKEYDKLSKTAYYYSAQVKEYKEMLKQPKKIERKALALLNKLPAFQKFMKQNSRLASLFRLPDNAGAAQDLTGLQTRSSVQGLIQQRIAAGGPNAQAQIQANLSAAHAEMNKLKDRLNEFTGEGGDDVDMWEGNSSPFGGSRMGAPNTQKTKSFLKRLEYGFDIQFGKSSSLLPNAANMALSLGYKLNDKGSAGIGASYKMGIGTIQHINITSQGLGLRSYMDWKIKKQLYVSGGYEMNYNSAFKSIDQLKNYDAWQRSALIGISKKYKISKKMKGEMKLLYDFLAREHVPVSEPFVFRLGYKF